MMVRNDLELQTDQLLRAVTHMSERTDAMLADALAALVDDDSSAFERVAAADVHVDRTYEQVQHGVLAAVALHGPVGRDLRLLTALIHVSLHQERMGDYAVNVARTAERSATSPADADLTQQLVEMGELARTVSRQAHASFVRGDGDLARQVAVLDDDVDQLNLGIFHRLVRLAAQDESRVQWAALMIQVTRQIERFADHGVDIAEQTVFVETGETVELSVPPRSP